MQVLRSRSGNVLLVACQSLDDARQGASLTNAAESFAVHAWHRYAPDLPGPPAMIEHYLGDEASERPAGRWGPTLLVTFTADPSRWLGYDAGWGTAKPWLPIVHAHAEPGRGSQYEPEPLTTDPEVRVWAEFPVAKLPPTDPFRVACMEQPSTEAASRALKLVSWPAHHRRLHVERDCCWYHRSKWSAAFDVLREVLENAEALGNLGPVMHGVALEQIRVNRRPDAWTRGGARSLLEDPICLESGHLGYVNGQHRAQAMIDQGTRTTLVTWHVPRERLDEVRAHYRTYPLDFG